MRCSETVCVLVSHPVPYVTTADNVALTDRILDAARACCLRWGIQKVTVDDIAQEAGVSRATLYRVFPGGREVLFDAMRDRRIRRFLHELDAHLAAAEDLDTLVAGLISHALLQMNSDTQLQLALASQPGDVARGLSVSTMPNIVRLASAALGPRLRPFVGEERSAELAEVISRVVVSYFLAPSTLVDLTDPAQALVFARRYVTPAFSVPTH